MKKKLLYIFGGLFVLALIGFVVLQFFLGSIVTSGVNRFAPSITQTKVVLGSAAISPLSGKGTLSDLQIGNPKGWSDGNLCSLGKVHLDVAPFSIFGDHIIINEITIDAPEFNYETKLISSNVADLLKNIESSIGGGKTAQATAKNGNPIKFEVKKFRLANGKVRIGAGGLASAVGVGGVTLPMPAISLDNLGTKEGGITPDQFAFAVMKNVTASVVSATASAALDIGKTGGAGAAEQAKKAVDGIKGLFGGKKE